MSDMNVQMILSQIRSMTAQAQGITTPSSTQESSFSDVFQQALKQASDLDIDSRSLTSRFQMGDPDVTVADAMVATQKSNIGFQAVLAVKNQLVQAYQSIMNMQI